ncbi:MAG TPA: DALR domain-containing protein, partial [Vampirovibrionales bacterium]
KSGFQKLQKCFNPELLGSDIQMENLDSEYLSKFRSCMNDDLNTPGALAVLFELSKEIRKKTSNLKNLENTLNYLLGVLGFNPKLKNKSNPSDVSVEPLTNLMLQFRKEAREAKEFAKADLIRDALQASGFKIQDSSSGSIVCRI